MTVRPYKEYLPMSPNQPIYTDLQGKFITVTEKALSSSWFFFSVSVCMKQPLVAI